MACSGSLTVDIGIVATPKGMDVTVGGKLGAIPKFGRRIARRADEEQVLTIIKNLIIYHNSNTPKKQRLFKLIDKPDFPYPEKV
jgi:NAD(P)H-nitrite reductase large subunit